METPEDNLMEDAKAESVAAAVEEFLERKRAGKAVTVAAFAAEYPDITAELTSLLPVMMDVEDAGEAAQQPPAAAADFPESLGDFRLTARIGSGGMGAVFRATQESLKREVAIKLLHPTWNGDAKRCEAFENESRLIAGLRHTNIVEVYGAGHENGFRYYVMGLVQGSGVSPKLLRRTLPDMPYERAVATVGLQAARALAFAHAHGVLHRDVKPGNILLDEEGVVHVSDFGLATVLNEGEDALLVTQCHDGTLRYMAPERLSKGENSFAGDQYGLGLTLYELLLRRPAFADCPAGTLIRHICETPVAPLRDEGELGAIINKSISFEPHLRYASVEEMADDLERYLNGRPVRARSASTWRRYALWCRRNRLLAVWSHAAAALALLFVLSLCAGYVQARRSLARENAQHRLALKNAQVADDTLQSLYTSMLDRGEDDDNPFTRADADLLEKLLPYCEELAEQSGGNDERVAQACRTLALITARLEDYTVAEQYYRRALGLLPADSADYVRTLRGLLRAVSRSNSSESTRRELQTLARETVNRLESSPNAELRLELVQLLMDGVAVHGARSNRGSAVLRAAGLLADVLQQQPQNGTARLLAVRLLAAAPPNKAADVAGLLAPDGRTPLQMTEDLLKEAPANAEYRRTYIQLVLRGNSREGGAPDLAAAERAAGYATALLSETPHDMGALMSYVHTRRLYTALLQRSGRAEDAAREQARTAGAVSLALEGSDIPTQDRQRLLTWLDRPLPDKAESAEWQKYRRNLSAEQRRRLQNIYGKHGGGPRPPRPPHPPAPGKPEGKP